MGKGRVLSVSDEGMNGLKKVFKTAFEPGAFPHERSRRFCWGSGMS
jgi:hypothetical protein